MSSPILESLRAIVAALTKRVDYHALYAATVVSQSGALVDVKPDSSKIPQLKGLKIRHGLPGFACVVPQGARVLVGFEDGDASKPYVALWESGSVTSVTFDSGSRAVARVDDTTASGALFLHETGGVTALYYKPQGGAWTLVETGLAPPVVQSGTSVTGKVTSGNTKLKA
jgi:hypothetical protein